MLDMSTKQMIGQAVRTLRKSRGLTLEQLAGSIKTIEIDAGNLSRFERGQQGASEELIQGISSALGVKISQLYQMVESPEKVPEITRTMNRELAKLEKTFLKLNGRKRKQALRVLQALAEE